MPINLHKEGKTHTMREKRESEIILEFCVELCRRMILSGANLERVQLAVERICRAYGLEEVDLFLLSHRVSLSVVDADGEFVLRQCTIPPAGIQLEQLQQLNRLSFEVVKERPEPKRLYKLLDQATEVADRPDWQILLAQIGALCCLGLIFGGGAQELMAVSLVAVVLHYVMLLSAGLGLDRVVMNAVNLWFATVAAILVMNSGISTNGPVILITVSMLAIPGIPLVNSVRNLLCGNEMNGILQLAKVIIETLSMGMGICVALWMFGMADGMSNAVVTTMQDPVLLVLVSFLASCGFAVVFRIANRDLWLSGLGGALTRVVLLLISPIFPQRIVFVTLAAMAAALYGELLATKCRTPSTYYIYPSIIPLIPGDLFYYALVALYLGDKEMFLSNGTNCLVTLVGMSIGFVLSSIIAHYVRRVRFDRLVDYYS